MIKQRLISGVLLAVILLTVILLTNQITVALLLGLILTIGAWEWMGLTKFASPVRRFAFAMLIAAIFLVGWFYKDHSIALNWLIVAVAIWFLILVMLGFYETAKSEESPRWQTRLLAFGVILLPAAWLALVRLYGLNPGWLIYALALCAIADSFAYLAGKTLGKRKLAPKLSPGKTLEGVLGGMTAVLIFALVVGILIKMPAMQLVSLVFLSLIAGLISVVGDLFVSMMKRETGLKDTGRILPGHGGILDRFDSHIAVAPVLYVGLAWIL